MAVRGAGVHDEQPAGQHQQFVQVVGDQYGHAVAGEPLDLAGGLRLGTHVDARGRARAASGLSVPVDNYGLSR
ncbi:hypothetical protein [Nonomuraea cavernae]|uniref:hypothetical protein n=1 Tax=Nonomuraea cavernae TaxID=2045107 RepID=UPI0033D528BA